MTVIARLQRPRSFHFIYPKYFYIDRDATIVFINRQVSN